MADLADSDGVARLIAELDRRGRTVDLLVNNAGAGAVGPFLSSSLRRNVDSVELNTIALMSVLNSLWFPEGIRQLGQAWPGLGHPRVRCA